jgi:hypothetical protein
MAREESGGSHDLVITEHTTIAEVLENVVGGEMAAVREEFDKAVEVRIAARRASSSESVVRDEIPDIGWEFFEQVDKLITLARDGDGKYVRGNLRKAVAKLPLPIDMGLMTSVVAMGELMGALQDKRLDIISSEKKESVPSEIMGRVISSKIDQNAHRPRRQRRRAAGTPALARRRQSGSR